MEGNSNAEGRIVALENIINGLGAQLGLLQAQMTAAQQQAWAAATAGGDGQLFSDNTAIVRVTTATTAATAPAYSPGAGVLQMIGATSPYVDTSPAITLAFESDLDRAVNLAGYAKLMKFGVKWFVIDVAACGMLT
jgi:hypothetical protein